MPQGIKESLGFSSVSTDITDARQILLHTLETLAEPDNPARDLLASALKVLNKALHTINEEVSSMAVQEPSDALGCEGVVTESPCDAVATQQAPTVVNSVVTESPCDAMATQETPDVVNGVVTESSSDVVGEGSEIIASTCNVSVFTEPLIGVQAFSEENIKLTVERGSSMFVHEPAESFTADGITNTDASIHDVSAASAVGESTKGNITLCMEIDFSLNSQVSSTNFVCLRRWRSLSLTCLDASVSV